MRQIAIITCMLITFTGVTFAQSETYYVSAYQGLNLRTSPGNGNIIKTLSLGDRVEIMDDADSLCYTQTLNHVPGEWVMIDHRGIVGYVFDGYLSSIPMPNGRNIIDSYIPISHAFVNYLKNNFELEATNYNIKGSTNGEVEEYVKDEITLKKVNTNRESFVYGQVPDVKIFEIYHVLYAMLDGMRQRDNFLKNSTYVKGKSGEVEKISVNTDDETIVIKKGSNDFIMLEMSYFFRC